MLKKTVKQQTLVKENQFLELAANMQGTLNFKDPVNLRINGNFEGYLDAKGNLEIGEKATVSADIKGENVTIRGAVKGNLEVSG